MIAADTSTWIAYLEGEEAADTDLLDSALAAGQLALPAPVLTEILSAPAVDPRVVEQLLALPLLEPEADFWARAGHLRARVLAKRRRARLGDALIAQLCIDRGIRLITRDSDFRAFAAAAEADLLA